MRGPLSAALALRIEAGSLSPDPGQAAAADRLDRLVTALATYAQDRAAAPNWLSRLAGTKPAKPPRGIFLHGPVGRGKTMLMDLFAVAAARPKRRVHFHAFMLEVHAALERQRREAAVGDPVGAVAEAMADAMILLCLDEFQVTDIADAMILARLLEALLAAGVVVVATSNRAPERLYEGGLNRERFLPCIALLRERLEVVVVDGPADHRLRAAPILPVYLTPPGAAATATLETLLAELTGGTPFAPEVLAVSKRRLSVPAAAGGIARFTFAELCARPLAASDYLALAGRYHGIVVEGVPRLGLERRNEARRLITLVDALYECAVMLVVVAEVPAEELYPAGDGAFEFQRTVSRLKEMGTAAYLERVRDRQPDDLPTRFAPWALTSDLI